MQPVREEESCSEGEESRGLQLYTVEQEPAGSCAAQQAQQGAAGGSDVTIIEERRTSVTIVEPSGQRQTRTMLQRHVRHTPSLAGKQGCFGLAYIGRLVGLLILLSVDIVASSLRRHSRLDAVPASAWHVTGYGFLVCCPAGDPTPSGVSITEVSVPGSDSPRIAALHSPAAPTASPVGGSSPGAQHASAEERPGGKVRSPGWQPGSPSQQGTLIKVSLGATKAANR